MAAKIDAILAAVSPAAGAEPIGVEAEAAKKGAVVRLVTDTAEAAERAARDIARGDVSGGFDILANEARAAEAEAANKWRRLGALAVGVDTARARAAYEEAFRLQPEDFWTCVELARLRRKAGDLAASRQAAEAAERAARTERERRSPTARLATCWSRPGISPAPRRVSRRAWTFQSVSPPPTPAAPRPSGMCGSRSGVWRTWKGAG